MKLRNIASLVNGEVIGPPEADAIEITGVSGIRSAQEGDITFLSNERHRKYLPECKASGILVKEPIEALKTAQLKVSNPHLAFAKLLGHLLYKASKTSGDK